MVARKIRTRRVPLDEERIVTTAFAILDEEGLDRLTVRRIAARLRVQNPALYWHFENKQAIVDRMAERLLGEAAEMTRAAGPDLPWRDLLGTSARCFRRAMRAHRDGARVVAAADLSESPMNASLAAALAVLVSAGFAEREALIGIIAVFDYTLGATFEEQEDPIRAGGPPRPGSAAAPAAPPRAALARASRSLGSGDAVFEGGLALLLDGLASRRPHRRR